MKVIIPLQLCSTRVPKKNVIPFYNGKSLFDIKVEQLISSGIDVSDIYVSSESQFVEALCIEKGVNFCLRDKSLTGNDVKQPDLIAGILNDIDLTDINDVMWVQVTNPLFNEFSNMLDTWGKIDKNYDSMVAVKKFKGHLLDDMGNPQNYSFGHWHKVSQKLPSWYEVLWSCFILKKEALEQYKYHIGVNPYLYVSNVTTVDIDTPDDFKLASEIFSLRQGGI
ncbi:cytidylyltransferase domain-containing protein [Aeromonas veronii]|jgi:CMP-N-acetylneuraminic acid synthetase|uniref:acylneuraminate cytidylyltransferase family protein n=1 Tax=Aeromonas veronii TaxID=654 RepID=UPI003BA33F0A